MPDNNIAQRFYDACVTQLVNNGLSQDSAVQIGKYALAQTKFESANFSDGLTINCNNPISMTYLPGNSYTNNYTKKSSSTFYNGSADDGAKKSKYGFCIYDSLEDSACDLADWLMRGDRETDLSYVDGLYSYSIFLNKYGYCDDLSVYKYWLGCKKYYSDDITYSGNFLIVSPKSGLFWLWLAAVIFLVYKLFVFCKKHFFINLFLWQILVMFRLC